MSDPQGQRRHWQFDWRLMLFTGLFLPLLIGLGLWQLDRAGQKQQMLDQWQQDALDLEWTELVRQGLDSGRPVALTGRYGERSWLLDNRTRDGIPGYEVLTVFHPLQGPAVVVNRGWVQAPRTRAQLPVVVTPDGVLELTGRLSDYPEPPVLVDQAASPEGWPRRVQSLPGAIARAEFPELPGAIVRLAGSDQPGAFRADWAPDLMGPQTHYGYATQWFALAVVLSILTVVASYRKTGANNDNDNG
ncbi:SURF1 family protein [Marinobacter sp. F4206]|uniref:SURF1 family protein n=1 Tax=Marinobacter sp. F4206 TaxID=2861777 RepID=UPI001C5DF80C|nr:SURF1 family protein [Marinobacter sp. F4206]MBW4935096.1 SURF1 family protein [Marinobacter sp. F4206]